MFEVYIGRLKFMAQALDKAGINNVLWGDAVKSLLIHPEIPKRIDYIVSDGMTGKACQALLADGLEACKRGEQCMVKQPWNGPVAAAHAHLCSTGIGEIDLPVVFWDKSSLLFAFPDLPSSPLSSDDPYYMPIRIPRTHYDPTARCPPLDLAPARMIRPVKTVEALIWLMCRDRTPNGQLERGWEDEWVKALEFWLQEATRLAEKGLFALHELRPDFAPLWYFFCNGEVSRTSKQYRACYLRLQEKLRAENALPLTPQMRNEKSQAVHLKWSMKKV
ncbi:hypothetical protein M752DRAFT_295330 [Aspergillus phoenicis ATCC 13157]|uniref:Uncharacterized protein n=1 Tax=Aspergillus phoenicis ATCC 13157 TaxID=1353007 RepID=A0A370PFE4_ASPPH|nr:hypothetical protein CBS147346_6934 [Aspergillus niger]RDK40900.1 hypothetical protein M752DRAFT_295330 [Aspergillus phoenicis ATCC 13157]GLA22236.1 hypothetical protein AnigIFM63326_000370 [Aspergillus niger]